VIVTVENDCSLGEKKNMNLPGCIVDLPTTTKKDEVDIVEFGLKYEVDIIALSFTRKGSDIEEVKKLLGEKGIFLKF
jgi:pyruvate kinase